MMPRQNSIDSNTSNSNNSNNNSSNNSMNVNAHGNMNYNAQRGGGGNNAGAGKPSQSVGDHIRTRYGHHGPGGGGGGDPGGGASSGGGGGQAAAAAAAMGDYGGLSNHQFGRVGAGLTPGLGSFNPGAGGMNASAMNPSLYPHLGNAAQAAALSQHQSSQQASLGEQLEYRSGGNSGASANPSAQAEREEELLLNLLIARRQRSSMRTEPQQMGPTGSGGDAGGGAGQSTSWADDWMRLRQQQEQLGASGGGADHNPYEGESSRRISARMSFGAAGGMGHLPNVNVNNINMSGAGAASQHNQFLADSSSRLQHQRGNGVGLQMGSPQGAWAGGNAAGANAGSMHNHQGTQRNENAYAHQRSAADMSMMSNTQLDLDILQRAEPMMRQNMMYDARMAEQGGMGQNPYHQYPMGRPHGQAHLHDRSLGFQKRQLEGHALKGMDKQGNSQQQMQQYFGGSPQKPTPAEEVQPVKKRRLHKKKPADMPRRPLSAYNLFFSEERERILREIEGKAAPGADDKKDTEEGKKDGEDESKPKALLRPLLPSEKKRRPHRKTHGKISFQELATKVGQRWKALPDDRRKYYQDLAQEDMKRQKKAMEEYYQKRSALTANEAAIKESG